MSTTLTPLEVFYSYADTDEPLLDELEKHLSQLKHQGLITTWHKRQITAGTNWQNIVDYHLNTASIILLLISADFLASDYCYGTEIQHALQRHETGGTRIIPILLSPVDWQGSPFEMLKALPSNGKPITLWRNRDAAFVDVVQGIRTALEEVQNKSVSVPSTNPSPPPQPSAKPDTVKVTRQWHLAHETIDTDEIVKLFRQFMDTTNTARVLYLVGKTKLGKSHLLTKVFPILAEQEYQARHAVIDLRYQMHTVPDILSLTSSQLDSRCSTHYLDACEIWLNKPKVEMKQVFLLLSSLKLSTRQEPDDLYKRDHHLTIEFIKDLATYNDRPLLLLVDHIDNATEQVQSWLINTFLVRTSLLKHIRVVVAGRSIPEPHGTYAAACSRYQLHPVTEVDAYIAYCRRLNVNLEEQSVRDFAHVFDYEPGMFVDYVLPKFWQSR